MKNIDKQLRSLRETLDRRQIDHVNEGDLRDVVEFLEDLQRALQEERELRRAVDDLLK